MKCLCRKDQNGRRWINMACRQHGVPSASDEPDHETTDALDLRQFLATINGKELTS